MNDVDRKALRPEPGAAAPGAPDEPARSWAPGVEVLYQRLRSAELGGERLVLVDFGQHGPLLAEGLAVVRQPGGGAKVIRARVAFDDLGNPAWHERDLDPGAAADLWKRLVDLRPERLKDDDSLLRTVRGEGAMQVYFQRASTRHQALGWAPASLASEGIQTGFRDLALVLRSAATEAD